MALSAPFDLPSVIKLFNQQYHRKIHPTKTWGLFYLQPENLEVLNESFHLLKYTTDAIRSCKNADTLQSSIDSYHSQNTVPSMVHLRALLDGLKSSSAGAIGHLKTQTLRATLNDPRTWKALYGQADTTLLPEDQIKKITYWQRCWKAHQLFYYHSSAGLLLLLQLIGYYQFHLQRALNEVNQRWFLFFSLPVSIKQRYKEFLQARQRNLLNLRYQVIQAILARLSVIAHSSNILSDSMTETLCQELKSSGFQMSKDCIPPPSHTLDAKTFYQLQEVIAQTGNQTQQMQLYQLPWYQLSNKNKGTIKVPLRVAKLQSQPILVPAVLYEYLPRWLGYPRWLFADAYARAQFFKEHQQLFVSMQCQQVPYSFDLATLTVSQPAFQQCLNHYTLLRQAHQQAMQTSIPWWHWRRRQLYIIWQMHITHYLKHATMQYVQWLMDLSRIVTLNPTLNGNKAYGLQLWMIAHHFYATIASELTVSEKKQVAELMHHLANTLQQAPSHGWIAILKALAEDTTHVSVTKKNYLVSRLQQMQQSSKTQEIILPNVPMFVYYVQQITQQLVPKIKLALKNTTNIEVILADMKILYQLGDNPLREKLAVYVDKSILRQIVRLKSTPAEATQKQVSHWINKLHIYGSNFLRQHCEVLLSSIEVSFNVRLSLYENIGNKIAEYYGLSDEIDSTLAGSKKATNTQLANDIQLHLASENREAVAYSLKFKQT